MTPAYRHGYILSSDPPFECDYLSGHVSTPHAQRRIPEAQRLLVLREPRARVVSHWLFARSFTPIELWAWGEWGKYLRLSHGTLTDFVSDARVACMHDNLVVRLLVGQDRRIPVEGMIAPEDDQALLSLARERLEGYDFVGLLEDADLVSKLEAWLGRRLHVQRVNEARPLPRRLRLDLDAEVRAAVPALEARTRLDRQLWADVAARQLECDPFDRAEKALSRSLASQRKHMQAPYPGRTTIERVVKTALLVVLRTNPRQWSPPASRCQERTSGALEDDHHKP